LHLGGRDGDAKCLDLRFASGLFRVKFVPRIEPIKYAKLMYNAAISPLAAAAGVDNGKLLSFPLARRLFFDLLQENYRILTAAGIALGKVGPFHPRTVAAILRRRWLAGIMARAFEPSLRGTYCSMAGEIQKGRTEIDNYNGHLIRLAEQNGTPCPLNRAVYDLVSRMSQERATPRTEVLDELASGLDGKRYYFGAGQSTRPGVIVRML
jgi:2-dehydropantoate 2-reductase